MRRCRNGRANEAELLESSIQVRDDAERAALEYEAANGQLGALIVKGGAAGSHWRRCGEERERMSEGGGGAARFGLGVRARHCDADANLE